MRSHPGSYRLSFVLPPALGDGRSPLRSVIRFDATVRAEVLGPSREAVLDAAAQFFRSLGAVQSDPISFSATLESPPGGPSGRDSWSVIIGADVAFSPTSLDPHLPPVAPRA